MQASSIITTTITKALKGLSQGLQGDLYYDDLMRAIYATDASVYKKWPLAVALPKSKDDIKLLIAFAHNNDSALIPRAAGTSLAGQCVGDGIVVDISKHFTKILDFDLETKTVVVEPGVVRDELNEFLKPYGLHFGPNTSTSNRCTIGGMVGNNSSGSTSIKYGVTRDKVLKIEAILSDGSEATFESVTNSEFKEKLALTSLEGQIYNSIYNELHTEETQKVIINNFPKPSIHRRNTGYAIDILVKSKLFSESSYHFNLCHLLSGSEGTLAFSTAITLKLDDLPPGNAVMVVLHFKSIAQCLKAIALAMQHDLYTCEMLDDTILNLTKFNKEQQQNRVFIKGDPKAILMCELKSISEPELQKATQTFLNTFSDHTLSYAEVVLTKNAITRAITLRKAGLGLLGNLIGDKKAVACIEDTAVAIEDIELYIKEFTALMASYQQDAVYYAHAGAGELHLRPILNLKTQKDLTIFKQITEDVAHLVKKYKGSMSGEHGDGIVRSSCIPIIIGEKNYTILKHVKSAFDPKNIFNPNKIVAPLALDKNLRYVPDREEPRIDTFLDFSVSKGILREVEKCNGSGDCRKSSKFGGTMCPSYRATKNEKDTTRARANALREFLTRSQQPNKFNHKELKEVFELCLSCKACVSECPSSVDVACLKAEFLYQYQKENGVSLRAKSFANSYKINKYLSLFPKLSNLLLNVSVMKNLLGIASKRTLPRLSPITLGNYLKRINDQDLKKKYIKEVFFFNDEFTNYFDAQIGISAIKLLERLNYKVTVIPHTESGRALISKGFLEEAKTACDANISVFKDKITAKTPLVGIEPSAIYTFKDEYLKLATDKDAAIAIANQTYCIEEFLQQEIKLGHIKSSQFTSSSRIIKFHGHCYQKALSNQKPSFDVLNLPKNYKVTIIPSGCCGMAGSFGYEKEHYDISIAIGEQTLFPAIRKAKLDVVIAANGTSCRHQIKDITHKEAKHPVEILYDALL